MRTITATEASRRFSDLLDAIERGDSVTVTRGNRPVAEIRPARRRTGRDLRTALSETAPPDDRFVDDVTSALSLLTTDRTDPAAHTDLTSFVVTNLTDAARRVLADRDHFSLSAEAAAEWERINRRPAEELSGLRRLMQRPSPFAG